ncbi:MAG: hypothetical protein RI572_00425 [Salegentibacter sp.]|uniref:hypothetical protein n=1 Tax=Salegentibacter TaxID=143222 RepID=UPI00158779A5|nr:MULTISPECIES: hypothetical protein [Salegentibacter]MDR9455846.1 hypothetical protein [Salegentibacter sp.]
MAVHQGWTSTFNLPDLTIGSSLARLSASFSVAVLYTAIPRISPSLPKGPMRDWHNLLQPFGKDVPNAVFAI